jgi:dihydrofolate synthase/folylpolyglutamate synthase
MTQGFLGSRWTFAEAQGYLESLELFGMRFGLDRMRRLVTALDIEIERLSAVQVLGTNGKSSTTRMVAAILHRHGLRSGAYLSPHLGSFAERVEVDERPLSQGEFAAAVQRAAQAAELVGRGLATDDHVTQFEVLTAAAFDVLWRAKIDVAVVEAGLGGRYDATSVIEPSVVTLTNVGLEHTRWLGPTERHVAEEKLAVVPEGTTIVVGPLGAEALSVAMRTSEERGATLLRFGSDVTVEPDGALFAVRTAAGSYIGLELNPRGGFQRTNFALAVATAEAFLGRSLDQDAVRRAAREVAVPGRLEFVSSDPLVLFDGAHNPAAAEALRASLLEIIGERKLTGVMSILDDKDAAAMLSTLLPLFERTVFTRSSHPRSLPPATLESLARQLSGPPTEVVSVPEQALERAVELAGPKGAVLVTGSIYLLSDLVRVRAARISRAV